MVKVKKDMSAYRIPNTDFLSFKFESPDVSDPDIDALFLRIFDFSGCYCSNEGIYDHCWMLKVFKW